MRYFSAFLAFFLGFSSVPIDTMGQGHPSEDFGQLRLRTEFHDAFRRDDLNNFKDRFGMVDVAEAYWIKRFSGNESSIDTPLEVSSAFLHWRDVIVTSPWNILRWGESLIKAFSLSKDRPIEFCLALIHHLAQFQFALFLCLSLMILIHLANWMPAIYRDFGNYFQVKSASVPYLLFTLILLWAFVLKSWPLSIFILLSIASVYCRRRALFFAFTVIFGAGLSLSPIFKATHQSLEDATVVEALIKGRNKVEYSPTALTNLPPDLQALWATRNLDYVGARRLMAEAPNGFISDALRINLQHIPNQQMQTIEQYLALNRKFPKEYVVLFNLAQLYGAEQDLASADHYRNQIPASTYSQLLDEFQRSDRGLIHPRPDSVWPYFLQRLLITVSSFFYSDDEGTLIWSRFFQMAFPWFVILFAAWFRNHASGICSSTGEPTTSIYIESSSLAERMAIKTDEVTNVQRQAYMQKRRAFDQQKHHDIVFWSWIFAPSYYLFEGKLIRAFVLSVFIFVLFGMSLPFALRAEILHLTGSPIPGLYGSPRFSLFIFLTCLALHFWIGRRSRRKAEE